MADSDGSDSDREQQVLFDDCNAVRRKINAFLRKGTMNQTTFLKTIGVNSNSYQRFMKQKGSLGGSSNSTYFNAYKFFEKMNKGKPKTKKRKEQEAMLASERSGQDTHLAKIRVHKDNKVLLDSHYYLHMSLESPFLPFIFAHCNERAYVQFKDLKLTPIEKLLATLDLTQIPTGFYDKQPTKPAFKGGIMGLAKGSVNSRIDAEVNFSNQMDQYRNAIRLIQDVDLVKKKIANLKSGKSDNTVIPSTPPPTKIEFDFETGEMREVDRNMTNRSLLI